MNVDDLRRELSERAEVTHGSHASARVAAVHARIAERRRRAVAGGVAAAALAIAGVALAPVALERVAQPAPPASSGTNRVAFPPRLNGDTLIAYRLNEPGESTVTWQVTVADLDVLTSDYCTVPATYRPHIVAKARLMMMWAVNGDDFLGRSCSTGGQPGETPATGFGNGPAANASVWRAAGAEPGKPFTISMRLEIDGTPVSVPQADFGLGLYARTGKRFTTYGLDLPEVLEGTMPGRFELVEVTAQPVARTRVLSARITQRPSVLMYGWDGKLGDGRMVAYLDGDEYNASSQGAVVTDTDYDAVGRHVLRVEAHGGNPDGTLVIAQYWQTG